VEEGSTQTQLSCSTAANCSCLQLKCSRYHIGCDISFRAQARRSRRLVGANHLVACKSHRQITGRIFNWELNKTNQNENNGTAKKSRQLRGRTFHDYYNTMHRRSVEKQASTYHHEEKYYIHDHRRNLPNRAMQPRIASLALL
jgi:hypothetical protein